MRRRTLKVRQYGSRILRSRRFPACPPVPLIRFAFVFRRHHIHLAWHVTVRTYRVLTWFVLIAGLLFAFLVLGLRYYVLPDIDRYRHRIEAAITRAAAQRVTIAHVSGNWFGYRPSLKLDGVVIFDRENRPALELGHVEAVLAWRSLAFGEVRMHTLAVDRPDLTVRRDANGALTVAGFRVDMAGSGSGFTDWLLAQEEIQIRSARLTWIDESRGAPPLTMVEVDLHLVNQGRQHRFGLQFTPPAEVAAMIDVRGDLRRRRGSGLAGWRGKLYARCGYVNLSAGKAWIDFPFDVDSGAADAEIWADVADGRLTQVTGDTRIAALSAHLGADLPPLSVQGLQGRLAFAKTPGGYEVSGRRLALVLGTGQSLGPADIILRRAGAGGYQVQADRLDIGPIAGIADALPLDAVIRSRLLQMAPRGRIEDLRLAWDSESGKTGRVDLEARFVGFGLAPFESVPGVSGLTGRIQADRNGGKLDLDSAAVAFAVPRQFDEPLNFQSLKGRAAWSYPGGRALVRLERLAFANADLAGTASGSYQVTEQGPGIIDLTAAVAHADARAVPKYVPLVAGPQTRKWLSSAFEAGMARDATFRVQGNLSDFPYDKPGKTGVFDVSATLDGVRLMFAPGWPSVDAIRGTFAVHGGRLEVIAEASILGIALDRTSAVIPRRSPHESVLEIKGGARGPTQEFLALIDGSPVGHMIGGFTRGMRVAGSGRLELDLRIPLEHGKASAIAGSYQFVDNQIAQSDSIPALADVNATVNFTQSGAKVVNATAKLFGLPARFSATSEQGGATSITAAGRASVAGLQRALDTPWLAYADGETDWKARAIIRNRVLDLVIDSDLVGVTSRLPPPLAKPAAEALPLRVQRRSRGSSQTLQIGLGQRLSAAFALDTVAGAARIKRGAVDFGTAAKLPEAAGVTVTGGFDRIDVDAWLDINQAAAHGKGGGDAAEGIELTTVEIKANQMEVFGRVLHEVALSIRRRDDLWDGSIVSREVAGDVDWIPGGRGKLVARLTRLKVPEPEGGSDGGGAEPLAGRDLPAIDVTADSFQFGALDLGGLVLKAIPNGAAWQVERLALTNPDFSFSGQGAWQSVRGTPRTQLQVKLDVTSLGGFQQRIRRPEGVVGGPATLEGAVEWAGVPYRLDYATLSGNLKLDVHRGRFLKLNPGIGKLLAVVSLQSLPRRVKLDFRDIFSEGFAFERITGTFAIANGLIHTNDMKMAGSSAKVSMKGDINMVDETQAL